MDEYAESTLIARESEVSQKVSETHRPIESPRRIAFLMYFGGGEEHDSGGGAECHSFIPPRMGLRWGCSGSFCYTP